MPRVRFVVGELWFFWRLTWPGFATILMLGGVGVANTAIQTAAAFAAMLGAAWWRDQHPTGKVVEFRRHGQVVHVQRQGRCVQHIVFHGRPNPLECIPARGPSPELAAAAIIEYVAGDIDVERLERDLDFYLRGLRG